MKEAADRAASCVGRPPRTMTALGHTEKNSARAYVFRFALRTRTLFDVVCMSQKCQQPTSVKLTADLKKKPRRYRGFIT
jgi:hypothetical protein